MTWHQPNETFASGFSITGVDADPFDANVIVMALSGTRGVYRSSDRGLTWSPVYSGLPFIEPTEVVFARDVPGRLYLAFRGRGVYRSDDKGDSWAPFALERPDLRRAGGGAVGLAVTSTAARAPRSTSAIPPWATGSRRPRSRRGRCST